MSILRRQLPAAPVATSTPTANSGRTVPPMGRRRIVSARTLCMFRPSPTKCSRLRARVRAHWSEKNATCEYCHPANSHAGNDNGRADAELSREDTNNDDSVDIDVANYKRIVSPYSADSTGFYRPTPKTCSLTACHASAPFTPAWYGDTVPPGNVTLNHEDGPEPRSIRLYWIAPGDDTNIDGTAYKYDIRTGPDAGTAANYALTTNFVGDVPTVKRVGQPQEAIIRNLTPGNTYYFSLRTYDENVIADPNTLIFGTSDTVSHTVAADLTPPVLIGSPQWYGVDSAKALDDGSVLLRWTRGEDHSMPITYDIFHSTGAINYGTPQKSTQAVAYRLSGAGISAGQSVTVAVRAKDFYNNTDTNTATLQVIPQALSTVPKAPGVYYANGLVTSNIPMQIAEYTTDGTATTLPAVFIGPTTFTKDTNIFANGFSINADNNNVAATTLRAELGYITGASTFNSFDTPAAGQAVLFATNQVVAKRSVRVVTFKFNGAQRLMKSTMAGKLGVRISISGTDNNDLIGWGPTSKGGILTFTSQPVNASPTVPVVTFNAVSGANVSFYWPASTDDIDDVADTVHYDVYGSANGGTDGFPYVIKTDLTTNATAGAPLVWNTQESGIVSSSDHPGQGSGRRQHQRQDTFPCAVGADQPHRQ